MVHRVTFSIFIFLVPVIESYEKPILQKKIKIEPGIEPQRTDYYPEEMSPPLMNSVSPPQALLQE